MCVCVCYRASCYIPSLYIESRVPLGFCAAVNLCIVWISPLPSSLLDELSMDKRDSNCFFLRTNNRSYNSIDSSLVTVDYQQSLLAFFNNFLYKTADQVRTWSCYVLCIRMQLHMHILVVNLLYLIVYIVASSSTVVQDLHNTITLH